MDRSGQGGALAAQAVGDLERVEPDQLVRGQDVALYRQVLGQPDFLAVPGAVRPVPAQPPPVAAGSSNASVSHSTQKVSSPMPARSTTWCRRFSPAARSVGKSRRSISR